MAMLNNQMAHLLMISHENLHLRGIFHGYVK